MSRGCSRKESGHLLLGSLFRLCIRRGHLLLPNIDRCDLRHPLLLAKPSPQDAVLGAILRLLRDRPPAESERALRILEEVFRTLRRPLPRG